MMKTEWPELSCLEAARLPSVFRTLASLPHSSLVYLIGACPQKRKKEEEMMKTEETNLSNSEAARPPSVFKTLASLPHSSFVYLIGACPQKMKKED
jgi:hypothetical protein